jgi:hypothetical protein
MATAAEEAGAADRLLAAARETIGGVRYCWAMTAAEGGGVNARLMGRLAPAVLVRLEVERIELCVPGITPEPFGSRYLALERGATRPWHVVVG